ncbi:MAG: NAD(P)H-dependent oxidoreductase [Candidatus Nanoarchaeia archaeon]|nr:NAD(P)H-dependent oxidoreductase [Candidatus Nanoarchaeia archaeon]
MTKILIILGHPSIKSTCETLMDNYIIGAKESNNEIKIIYLSDLENDFTLSQGYNKIKENQEINDIQKNITWCDKLVLFYPIWWATMPGITKSLLERILLPKFAFKYSESGQLKGLLNNKKVKIITTSNAPNFFYQLFQSKTNKLLIKGIFKSCGIKKIKFYNFGSVINTKDKSKWFNKIYNIGKDEK